MNSLPEPKIVVWSGTLSSSCIPYLPSCPVAAGSILMLGKDHCKDQWKAQCKEQCKEQCKDQCKNQCKDQC